MAVHSAFFAVNYTFLGVVGLSKDGVVTVYVVCSEHRSSDQSRAEIC